MNRDELKRQLKEFIIERLSLESVTPESIDDDAPLFGDGLQLDSLDAVEIIVILQRKFHCDVKQIKKGSEIFRSINALADFIESQQHSEP
ncbi:MAG: acyl carrier protein [Kiritimatiellae bacterium]|nr:acyl carrier protein [Kiritimatiellia bacterium]